MSNSHNTQAKLGYLRLEPAQRLSMGLAKNIEE